MHARLALIHVCNAVVGLLSGALAMTFRKGSGLHRAAGTIFFGSMLIASAAGAGMAIFTKPNSGNLMGAVLSFYLVATAWMAARRRDGEVRPLDLVALAMAMALAIAGGIWGIEATHSAKGVKDAYPSGFYFVFGSFALLFAVSDVRMIARGGTAGAQRLTRHIWRMCLALLFALMSFYPSRASLFSKAVNDSHLMYVPHVLVAGATIFWMIRVRRGRRARRDAVVAPLRRNDAAEGRAA